MLIKNVMSSDTTIFINPSLIKFASIMATRVGYNNIEDCEVFSQVCRSPISGVKDFEIVNDLDKLKTFLILDVIEDADIFGRMCYNYSVAEEIHNRFKKFSIPTFLQIKAICNHRSAILVGIAEDLFDEEYTKNDLRFRLLNDAFNRNHEYYIDMSIEYLKTACRLYNIDFDKSDYFPHVLAGHKYLTNGIYQIPQIHHGDTDSYIFIMAWLKNYDIDIFSDIVDMVELYNFKMMNRLINDVSIHHEEGLDVSYVSQISKLNYDRSVSDRPVNKIRYLFEDYMQVHYSCYKLDDAIGDIIMKIKEKGFN